MLLIFILLVTVGLAFLGFRINQKRLHQRVMRKGDIVVLRSAFSKDFPTIPRNNVLHIIEVEPDFVAVEYLNFKDGSYCIEKLEKKVLKKIPQTAA